ncbi:MAG: VOC family protein [Sphingobium sp.]
MRIVAPQGSALHAAVVGVEDLAASMAFYRDIIGLEVVDEDVLEGEGFGSFWHLPPGARAPYAALADRGNMVGRILLIQFPGDDRVRVRTVPNGNALGLMNINFYTSDIRRDGETIAAAGYPLWSQPVRHQMAAEVGSPTEVLFDGPDGMIVNLVELSTSDMTTRIGQMRDYVHNEVGLNARGFTPVVTTLHVSPDIEKEIAFFREAVGMEVLFRDVLSTPDQNHFSRFPEGSSTACAFLQGNDMFGKICMTQPVDYVVPDPVPLAQPPNIGYLAQAFVVADVAAAAERGRAAGGIDYSPVATTTIPGLGETAATILRTPGSHALVLLVEARA